MQDPVKVGSVNTAGQNRVVNPAEIVKLVKAEVGTGEKGIIIDLHFPDSDLKSLEQSAELWIGAKIKADTRKETKNRHKWKRMQQGEGRLVITGIINASLLLQRIVNEIQRPIQMIRLREVVDFRHRPHLKAKIYLLSATWFPRTDDEKDEATVKVDLRQLWTRIPPKISIALDAPYKFQVYNNPESIVLRILPTN